MIRKSDKRKKDFLHRKVIQEVKEFGVEIRPQDILKFCFMVYSVILVICYIYKLNIFHSIILLILGTASIPYHVYHRYRNLYDWQKWNARLHYMEQMLSSFKRHPKMLEAYQDTLTVFVKEEVEVDKRMANAIRKAISIIQEGEKGNEDSFYKNAAKEIEEEYGCHRLTTMHEYMEKVEQRGGEYKKAADILMQEHALWKTNMEKLKKDQKTKRIGVFMVSFVCILICALPAYLNRLLEGFTENKLYQLTSMIFLALQMILLLVAENKLNTWWNFDSRLAEEEKVLKNYRIYQTYDMRKHKRKYFLIAAFCYGLAVLGGVFHNYIVTFLGLSYGIYVQRFPISRYRALRRSAVKNLEYQYPQWMMELSLLLQTENVFVSLQQAAQKAPAIIREEVEKLAHRLENEPASVEPYNDFFGDLYMDNIVTSMRNLYSIDSLGVQEESSLLQLIAHNNELMNKAEQIKGQEKLNIWTVYMYLPLLAGGGKIIMDTVLLCGAMIASALQSV